MKPFNILLISTLLLFLMAGYASASFTTIHPHEGRTYWTSADGQYIFLINNNAAKNPTYAQVIAVIKRDKTDQRKYVSEKYTCGDFAETVHNNAEKAGYKAGWVPVYGINHVCNVFDTTDKGRVYIDCTGSNGEKGIWDTSVKIANGKTYQRVSLFNTKVHISPSGTVKKYIIYW